MRLFWGSDPTFVYIIGRLGGEQQRNASLCIPGLALQFSSRNPRPAIGTWFNPDGDVAHQVRQQQFPIVGSGEGVIEDAAMATVRAAEQGRLGAYLIANDKPLAVRQWLPAFAEWLNAPPPPQISVEDALKAAGADAVYYGSQMRGASNAKAKRDLNFQPRPLEWIVDHAWSN